MAQYKNEKVNRPNVIDEYQGMERDQIKNELKAKAFGYGVLMEHWLGDFNLATCFRNANAFGAQEVFYLGGKKKFDPRGCVGVQYYTDLQFLPDYDSLADLQKRYTFVGLDIVPGSVPIENFEWPSWRPPLLVFGEEGAGLTKKMMDMCSAIVSITQYGSVRSINAGVASGIAMFQYVNYLRKNER